MSELIWIATRKGFNGRPIYWCKDAGHWRWTSNRALAVPYKTETAALSRAGDGGTAVSVQMIAMSSLTTHPEVNS